MNPEDLQGWNLKVVMEQTGLKNNVDYMFTPPDLIKSPPDPGFLNCIYNASDVYLTTTSGEGFGLTILEAMAAKVPVIAPWNTSIKEINGSNRYSDKRLMIYRSDIPYVSRFDNMVRTQGEIEAIAGTLSDFAWMRKGEDEKELIVERLDEAHEYAMSLNWRTISLKWIDEFKKLL